MESQVNPLAIVSRQVYLEKAGKRVVNRAGKSLPARHMRAKQAPIAISQQNKILNKTRKTALFLFCLFA